MPRTYAPGRAHDGSLVYYLPDDGVAFVGDTLFADDVAVFARMREVKDRF